MKVELLDAATVTDREIQAWHDTVVASYLDLWPDEPPPPLAHVTERVRNPGTTRPYRVFAAWDDAHERVLGAAETWWWDHENAHRIMTDLYVAPDARHHGVGRAIIDAIVVAAKADGRTSLLGGARYDTAGVDFCKTIGMKFGLDEYRSRIFLHRATLQPIEVPGFSLMRFVNGCPDEWVERFCRITEVMNTAPQGGDVKWNEEKWTVERMRTAEADQRAKKLTTYYLCAIDDATAGLVALTGIQVFDKWPEVGEQHDTGVLPEYRGKGLAKLVKTEMAHWLQRERPELQLVSTWNACENVAMLAVNASLGYGDRERWAEAELVFG